MKLELNNVKDGNLGYCEFKKGKVIIEKIEKKIGLVSLE